MKTQRFLTAGLGVLLLVLAALPAARPVQFAALSGAAGLFGWLFFQVLKLDRGCREKEKLVTAYSRDLETYRARMEDQKRELSIVFEKLARISELAPASPFDVETRAKTVAEEIGRQLGAEEFSLFVREGAELKPVTRSASPPSLAGIEIFSEAPERCPIPPGERVVIPLRGPLEHLFGVLAVRVRRGLDETERLLVVRFVQQLIYAMEVRRLHMELQAAARRRASLFEEYHARGIATLQVCTQCGRCEDDRAPVCLECGGALEAPRPIPYRLVGRYRFEAFLGQGGMGMVFAAFDESLDREVAIKLIRPDQLTDARTRIRFQQEARTVACIAHRNVVVVYDSGEIEDGTAFLVMERLRGSDLDTLIGEKGRGRADEVAALVRQTSSALGAAHRVGIIHRDIKPQNIYLESGKRGLVFKVLDFGLAKSMTTGRGLTLSGTVVGTPAYMSPEQVHGEPIDERSDIYSLAVVVFEALTGVRLVTCDDVGSAFLAVANDIPPLPSECVKELTHDVDVVLLQALAKDRERRPRQIEVWGEALASALDGVVSENSGWEPGARMS